MGIFGSHHCWADPMGDTQDSDPNPVTAEQPDETSATNSKADASEPAQSAAESPSEPLISKKAQDDVDELETSPIVYDPDDGLDFESNMGKMMIPMMIAFLASGWVGFTLMDDMDALDGLYMTFVTITTVGYGDFSPQNDGTKIFFIFWIFFGLSVVATGLAMLVDTSTQAVDTSNAGIYRKTINAIDTKIGKTLRKLMFEILLLLLFIAGGAIWVCTVEGFPFVTGIYWAVQTLTTVGYGDLDISKDESKVFVIVYAVFGTALTVTSLAAMACLWVEYDQARKVQTMIEHGLTMKMINVIDIQKTGHIDKYEFLRYMLWKLDKVDGETMDKISNIFDALDVDGGGTLGPEDFVNE